MISENIEDPVITSSLKAVQYVAHHDSGDDQVEDDCGEADEANDQDEDGVGEGYQIGDGSGEAYEVDDSFFLETVVFLVRIPFTKHTSCSSPL